MTTGPALVWDLHANLGEGPVWDSRDGALWFTDIKGRLIHRYDPATGDRKGWDTPGAVGFIVPAQGGGFVAGIGRALHHFDPAGGKFTPIAEVDANYPNNRLNDAVVDPAGRLWFGTMDEGERARTGSFYCFHRGEVRQTGLTQISITNGPAVSPDGMTLYWVDTLPGKVFACAIRGDLGLGPSELIFRIDPKDGHPDGPTVDSEGAIWIGIYGGWEARRYSPAGELLGAIRFPVANITKLALGGRDFRRAFATSACHLLSGDALKSQPLAGGLFAFEVEVPGIPSPAVAV